MTTHICHHNDAQSIHVGLDVNERWFVACGSERPLLGSFRFQVHAEAYGRALAYSRHLEMIVHSAGGGTIRHARASLTYPTFLD